MRNKNPVAWGAVFAPCTIAVVIFVFVCFSCASKKAGSAVSQREKSVPALPEKILGRGRTNSKALAQFLLLSNPLIDRKFAENFAKIYIEEAEIEGVNHDVAFSQMCLETGFLSFGGDVTPEMNNFCGLGSLGGGIAGERFPNPRIGVRAQIQHLKAYATAAPLKQQIVDPRRRFVRPGSAPTIDALAGAWAEDREYGNKIKMILSRLYRSSFGS